MILTKLDEGKPLIYIFILLPFEQFSILALLTLKIILKLMSSGSSGRLKGFTVSEICTIRHILNILNFWDALLRKIL